MCSSVDKEDVIMRLRVVGFSSEGKRLSSFFGEVDRGCVDVVVRGVLSSRDVDWASVAMWDGTELTRHYWVEKDFSWRRLV